MRKSRLGSIQSVNGAEKHSKHVDDEGGTRGKRGKDDTTAEGEHTSDRTGLYLTGLRAFFGDAHNIHQKHLLLWGQRGRRALVVVPVSHLESYE